MVVTRLAGETSLTIRGPETKATTVHCPANGEWLAIRFKCGHFMPRVPVSRLVDGRDVTLPQTGRRSFRLDGASFELPTFEQRRNVCRAARQGRA